MSADRALRTTSEVQDHIRVSKLHFLMRAICLSHEAIPFRKAFQAVRGAIEHVYNVKRYDLPWVLCRHVRRENMAFRFQEIQDDGFVTEAFLVILQSPVACSAFELSAAGPARTADDEAVHGTMLETEILFQSR